MKVFQDELLALLRSEQRALMRRLLWTVCFSLIARRDGVWVLARGFHGTRLQREDLRADESSALLRLKDFRIAFFGLPSDDPIRAVPMGIVLDVSSSSRLCLIE